ncbi:MAG: hypothetical protein JNM42_17840 [Propionivibrio sp.]|uniref:hypothetical protein n=1 Tax=Propionivibrio sp. TaxID=2212460 RepID=UPI001A5FDE9F|nr:hypothetical protein [Propionivibrio sp.]MBL8416295.1 hypothetical protein [Propionivibrio sp.]
MSTRKSVSIVALSLALAGGMIATPAFAADNSADMMKMMDTNKNGMIEKDEYLAYHSKVFDKMPVDKKGGATMQDVMKSFRDSFDFKTYGYGG